MFVDAADSYLSEKSKKPRGPSTYLLNRSIETHGKAAFLAQHTGYDLTHKDNLKVAERWDKIVAAVNE